MAGPAEMGVEGMLTATKEEKEEEELVAREHGLEEEGDGREKDEGEEGGE